MNYFESILAKFSNDIAIDLGTANIRVFVKGRKDIIKEPSIIALNTVTGKVVAVGNEARQMIGRTPSTIKAVQPLKKGVISDFSATEALIRYFVTKVNNSSSGFNKILKPRVVIGVPTTVTEVEINSVIDSARSAGARRVYIVEEPMASAIGANLMIDSAAGSMIVDIGGGTTDIALISLGGIVRDNTIRTAGDEMDNAIIEYIKNKYNLLIGVKQAEDIKINYASAIPKNPEVKIDISGQDILSGLPKSTRLHRPEVTEALLPVLDKIANSIRDALENVQPEMLSDLIKNGIYLSGGGALIEDIDKYFSLKLKVPFKIATDPSMCVTKGITKLMERVDLLEKHQVKDLILK